MGTRRHTVLGWTLFGLGALLFRPLHAQEETVSEALVMYGDDRLVENDEPLSDDRLTRMIDSLCALDPAPQELIQELRLFRRIRTMDEEAIVALVDSLFELEEVPYALVNEINLHIAQMPSQQDVDAEDVLPWTAFSCEPGNELYGAWNTTNPNAYGPVPDPKDDLVLLQLTRENCDFSMPVCGTLTSRFGWRDGRPHNGVDIDLDVWDTVCAAFPGVVRFAGTAGGFGRLVVVRHYNGLETFYAHLHRLKVRPGDEVEAGDLIGLGGSSGHSTGSHLHFEVRFKGVPVDPAKLVDVENGSLLCDTLVLQRTRWSYAAYPRGTRFHTVGKGEHLYAIAEQYGVSIDDLCTLNGISPRYRLRAGQRLLVADLAMY